MSERDSPEAPPPHPSPARAEPARPKVQDVPVRDPSGEAAPQSLWQKLSDERDIALLVLLGVLNVGSAYTTIIGARQILPAGMSDIVGAAVQAMLFLMLAGFAMNRSFFRRWMAIGLFAFASVYTSFFTYYEQLAKEADLRAQLDRAMQVHAVLVSEIYQPARSEAEKLLGEAHAQIALADAEAERGVITGFKGNGPQTRELAAKAQELLVQAKRLEADVNRLEPHFEYEMEGLAAEDVYRRDLEAWQLAPADWKIDVPTPVRADYVDMQAQVALLTPYNRVRAGEMPALTALGLAMMVDGIAIFLGTAIRARRRNSVESRSHEAAVAIRRAQRSIKHVWGAVRGRDPEPVLEDLGQAIPDVPIDIDGLPKKLDRAKFLARFYEALHPQSMVLMYSDLKRSPDEDQRIAARMLVDQLREFGWVRVDEDGFWVVPGDKYVPLTRWLSAQIRRAQEREPEADSSSYEAADGKGDLRLLKDVG